MSNTQTFRRRRRASDTVPIPYETIAEVARQWQEKWQADKRTADER